jgi:hypothetical protein
MELLAFRLHVTLVQDKQPTAELAWLEPAVIRVLSASVGLQAAQCECEIGTVCPVHRTPVQHCYKGCCHCY